jgi:ABC-type multidrug transport system fused ATPase/permease subunit
LTILQKFNYLLSSDHKRKLLVLAGLLLIAVIFEMVGLGVLIPALSLLLNPDIGNEYPLLIPFLEFVGNPTQTQLIIGGMLTLVFIYIIKTFYIIFFGWKQSKFTAKLTSQISQQLFLGYLHQPYTIHLQRNSAELISNIQTEVNVFNNVAQSTISIITEFSVVFSIALMLVLVEPFGALVVISFLTLSALGFYGLTKNKLLIWGKNRVFHSGKTNQHLMQGLAGVKEIKLLGLENYFFHNYSKHNIENTKIQIKVSTLNLLPRPYLEFLAVSGLAGLIILMVNQGKPMSLLLPTLGVFVAAAFRMIPSVNRIMSSIQVVRYANPVIDKLYNEFKMIREHHENLNLNNDLNFSHKIKIVNLQYQYPNVSTFAIDGVSLTINKGETVGFFGASGSGKSTLMDIILGLLSPTNGTIMVDSIHIQTNPRKWQDLIGYVPQSIYLTDDSLRNNVAFGIPWNEIDNTAVNNAIRAAQLDGFVESLSEGLDTYVGERGVRLSGGQRQRIGIARALYNDPQVLVLDEATSALDSETETGVMDSIRALHGTKTILIVAHRLSTLSFCDRLYRLENGKFVIEKKESIL